MMRYRNVPFKLPATDALSFPQAVATTPKVARRLDRPFPLIWLTL